MPNDSNSDDTTRRLDVDRDRPRPDLERRDGVEAAILDEMRAVQKALGDSPSALTRRQFETQLDALETKLLQHRARRDRGGNMPGDPYHRTSDEVQAESARLGAGH